MQSEVFITKLAQWILWRWNKVVITTWDIFFSAV